MRTGLSGSRHPQHYVLVALAVLGLTFSGSAALSKVPAEAALTPTNGILVPGGTADTGDHTYSSTAMSTISNWTAGGTNATSGVIVGNWVNLVQDTQQSVGYATFNGAVDTSAAFSLTATIKAAVGPALINLKNFTDTGDALGFLLTAATKAQLAANATTATGPDLGIDGLPNSYFLGRDLYSNLTHDGGIPCGVDGCPSGGWVDGGGNVIAIRTTSATGSLVTASYPSGTTTGTTTGQAWQQASDDNYALGLYTGVPTTVQEPVTMSWTPDATSTAPTGFRSGTLSFKLVAQTTSNGAALFPSPVNGGPGGYTITTKTNLPLSMTIGFLGGTGGNYGNLSVSLNGTTGSGSKGTQPVTVRYVDSTGQQLASPTTITANVGDSVRVAAAPVIPPATPPYAVGNSYTFGAPAISGYYFSTGGTLTVTNSATANVITVTYASNPVANFSYQWAAGTPGSSGTPGVLQGSLPATQTVTGAVGQIITGQALSPAPTGYTATSVRAPNGKDYAVTKLTTVPTASSASGWYTDGTIFAVKATDGTITSVSASGTGVNPTNADILKVLGIDFPYTASGNNFFVSLSANTLGGQRWAFAQADGSSPSRLPAAGRPIATSTANAPLTGAPLKNLAAAYLDYANKQDFLSLLPPREYVSGYQYEGTGYNFLTDTYGPPEDSTVYPTWAALQAAHPGALIASGAGSGTAGSTTSSHILVLVSLDRTGVAAKDSDTVAVPPAGSSVSGYSPSRELLQNAQSQTVQNAGLVTANADGSTPADLGVVNGYPVAVFITAGANNPWMPPPSPLVPSPNLWAGDVNSTVPAGILNVGSSYTLTYKALTTLGVSDYQAWQVSNPSGSVADCIVAGACSAHSVGDASVPLNANGDTTFFNNSAGLGPSSAYTNLTVTLSYVLHFDPNSAAYSGSMADQVVVPGTDVKLEANGYSKGAYRFVGWNTCPNPANPADPVNHGLACVAYADQAVVKGGFSANTTLYAQWAVQMVTGARLAAGQGSGGLTGLGPGGIAVLLGGLLMIGCAGGIAALRARLRARPARHRRQH